MAQCIGGQCGKYGFFHWWTVGGRLPFTLVVSEREMAVCIGGQWEKVSSLQGKYVGGRLTLPLVVSGLGGSWFFPLVVS